MAQPGSPQVQEEAQSGGAAEAGKAAEPSAHAAAQEPPTVVSPKLEETDAAVIIRRRDTLWQISRRVYGHGIRYSTIYLANQDQIRDPDRIWPGQVFRVPDKSHEGDAADMSRLGKQATTVPAHVE
jgi:nucleoid-associated protein YgaU